MLGVVAFCLAVLAQRRSRQLAEVLARNRALQSQIEARDQEARERSRALRDAEGRLREESMTDQVTGIANRAYFDRHFPNEWKRATRRRNQLAVLLVSVDQLAAINARHGVEVGDACLRAVGGALDRVTKRAEDFVARYAGTAFVVVAPNADAEGGTRLAERIHGRMAALDFLHDSHFVPVTVSIGISAGIPKRGSRRKLIDAAREALDEARETGGDRTIVASVAMDGPT